MNQLMNRLKGGFIRSARQFLNELRERRAESGLMAEETSADRFLGNLRDGPKFEAPKRLKAASSRYFTTETYLAQMHRADWQHCHRAIQEFGARVVLEFRRRQIPLFVHCAYRDPEEQDRLKARGFSKASGVLAPHPRGCAVDIIHSRHGWEMTDQEWFLIGTVAKDIAARMGIEIEWGGDWRANWPHKRGWDPAHFELVGWKDQPGPFLPGPPRRLTPLAIKGGGWQYIKGYSGKRSKSS